MKETNKGTPYWELLRLLKGRIGKCNKVEFEIGIEELREELGLEEKYERGGKFLLPQFKYHCLKPNLRKIEEWEKFKITLKSKEVMVFEVERLGDYKEEIQSDYTPKNDSAPKKVEEKEEKRETEEQKGRGRENISWEEKSGLGDSQKLYPFSWLRENEARKVMYCLQDICETDRKFFYKELLKAIIAKEIPEEILPYIRALDEEYGVIPSKLGGENRVVLLPLKGENEASIFNILVKNNGGEYGDILCEKAFSENCSVIAITGEVLRFYKSVIGKLKGRVQWPEEDEEGEITWEDIVKMPMED